MIKKLMNQGKPYLIILDNLEVNAEQIKTTLQVLKAILDDVYKNKPWIIITSRIQSDKKHDQLRAALGICLDIQPAELSKEDIKQLVEYRLIAEPKERWQKAKRADQEAFIEVLHTNFSDSPELIFPAIKLLYDNSLKEVTQKFRRNLDSIKDAVAAIYQTVFSYLEIDDMLMLFLMMNDWYPDTLKSKEDIVQHIYKMPNHLLTVSDYRYFRMAFPTISFEEFKKNGEVIFCPKYTPKEFEKRIIVPLLDKLVRYHLIYKHSEGDVYSIKSRAYLTFMFSDLIHGQHDTSKINEEGQTLPLDYRINPVWKLLIALDFDQPPDIVESVCESAKELELFEKWIEGADAVKMSLLDCCLLSAAENTSYPEIFDILLHHDCKLDSRFLEVQKSVLHIAAQVNPNREVIKKLLELYKDRNMDINPKDKYEVIPLMEAIANQNAEILEELLIDNHNAILIGDKFKWIALHYAAGINSNEKVISTLLDIDKTKKTLRKKDKDGQTPLMVAAKNNPNPQIAIALICAGSILEDKDNTGKTALDYLKEREDWAVIESAIKSAT